MSDLGPKFITAAEHLINQHTFAKMTQIKIEWLG